MLTFRNILNFPSFFRDRQNSVNKLRNIMIQKAYLDENRLTIIGNVNNHTTVIQFDEKNVDMNNVIRVSCDCQSFSFEFARVLFDSNALYQPENFTQFISKVPKKKNIYSIPSGCKHVIALARFVNKNQFKLGV